MEAFPLYSPEEVLRDALFDRQGLELVIKRDDMIHPFISGNKWRKLRYQLEKARLEGKEHLVSFGGAYSNHLLALAAAAAKFGFKSSAFLRGELNQPLNDTLFLCRQFGMELIPAERQQYRDRKMELFQQHFGHNDKAFLIDEGGRSPLALRGCAEIIDELERPYDHIFVPCGTGTTLAGIALGLAGSEIVKTQAAHTTRAEGIAVLKNAGFLEKDITELFKTAGSSGRQPKFRLHLDFHQGGYAKSNPAYLSWLQAFHRRQGFLLDPVYTGKMLYAIFQLAEQGYFRPGSRILAIHTGGLFGLLGMKEQLGA